MQHIASQLHRTVTNARQTERGEMMRYFVKRLNVDRIMDGYPKITMGHMGKILEQIPTKDLYYIKRVCDDAKHFSKKFWWELEPENHTEEKRKERMKAGFPKKPFRG